jgi:secreted PhoX family phosphatase
MSISRRQFVRQGAAVTAGFMGLERLLSSQAPPGFGRGGTDLQGYLSEVEGYGPLLNDPRQIMDLPKGFSYKILSRSGMKMDDGFVKPAGPDGMAPFAGPNGRVILVRNHELQPTRPHEGPFGFDYEMLPSLDRQFIYDYGKGRPHQGGTTTLIYDPATGRVERQFLSLIGTQQNCAGGPTPWNSWLSCEETVELPNEQNEQRHGYNFEVSASATRPVLPVPLKEMGRFMHEAVAVHPRTSIVYQTEDRNDGLIYRFIPNTPRVLARGGRLQVLTIRDRKAYDTRNYAETGAPRMPVGQDLSVRWVDIPNPDTERDDLRTRGVNDHGAALFARGEGMWYGNDVVYFACTNGGLGMRGQIFKYTPSSVEGNATGEDVSPGKLQLYLEPNNSSLLESCDNVTVAPWGDLFICEDNAAPTNVVARYGPYNFLRGVTPTGKIYTIGRNRYPGGSELSGICFAPNHPTMFVNIQHAGLTLAITGPWQSARRS